jgi:hypothetical protein
LKDIKKGGFTRKAAILYKDEDGFIYGTLKKIDLVESIDEDKIKDKKKNLAKDEVIREHVRFSFDFKTIDSDNDMRINTLTGTVFNKEPVNIKFKSRGTKVLENIYNVFTHTCLSLKLLDKKQLDLYDNELNIIMEERLSNYNDREENDFIKIKCKLKETPDLKKQVDEYTIEVIKELPKIN